MDYEPIARLGRGGMGVVDLARDPNGNRVALKRLTLNGSASDILRARQRLLREASVLRRLHHRNVVRLLDVVEEGDDIVLVMPYLNGGNLAERVGQHGPAPPEEIGRLAQRLLGALATAHAAGVVHRDVKPANVLFDETGEPCLADFGVAHAWDQTSGLTVTGMVVGTPGFMAPEQARDEQLTPASDIFSLGATLLYAATGVGPFGSGDPGLLMVRAAAGKVERLPKTLPAGLRRRLRAMLQPRPERRPTAAALLTGDQSALRRPPSRARINGTGPAVAFAAFAGAVVLVGVTVSATRGDSSGDADSDTPPAAGPDTSGDSGVPGEPELPEAAEVPTVVDQVESTIEPGGEVDAYILPMGQPVADECPADVRVVLEGPPEAFLRIQAVRTTADSAGETVLDEQTSDVAGVAVVAFRPTGCGDPAYAFHVLVSAVEGGEAAVPYRITREDS